MPAHVTVLFPFLDASRIDEGVCAAIGEVVGRHPSFEARFDRCGRFPGVLYQLLRLGLLAFGQGVPLRVVLRPHASVAAGPAGKAAFDFSHMPLPGQRLLACRHRPALSRATSTATSIPVMHPPTYLARSPWWF
ncbi:2'-5' RNA ligase family protein [Streptomyces sp. NPDC058145]|uniref:2'-5' RNA ligase family protein n=1 Tax=Streptomyces sp. NPDC058145 TaxID=3346356 RepID=UPI0036F0F6B4